MMQWQLNVAASGKLHNKQLAAVPTTPARINERCHTSTQLATAGHLQWTLHDMAARAQRNDFLYGKALQRAFLQL